jgi:hypothetical protein
MFCGFLAVISILLVSLPVRALQEKPADNALQDQNGVEWKATQSPLAAELAKYPGLMPELINLQARIMKAIELPASRTQSRLLPMMPDSTVVFAAVPNYGNALHQALQAFQQELKESEVLRNWWQHSTMNAGKPGPEEELEKLYQFSQYIGDEIALSVDIAEKREHVLVIAEIRKPGLKLFLEQMGQQLGSKSSPVWRIYDPQQLALAREPRPFAGVHILVRPDFLILSPDLATLRGFNATLSRKDGKLPASPFGQRLAQSYQTGAEILAGIDAQRLMAQVMTGGSKDREMLQRSGFGDMKYLIWERKLLPGQLASQAELSFNGKRHGVASWLAAPAKLGGLDFVAPDATIALSMMLKNPAQIFDDLAGIAGPDAMAPLTQGAAGFDINFRNDVLRQLTGEVAVEMNGPIVFSPPGTGPSEPEWKLILGVNDAEGLQKTFDRLSAALSSMDSQGQGPSLQRHETGRLPHYTLRIPSPQKATEITLAFSDGYMLVAPRRALVTDAVRYHREASSLMRSGGFYAALPPGLSADASALYYQNFGSAMATMMQSVLPELARLTSESGEKAPPAISTVYADEAMIRQASGNGSLDVGVILAVTAIAIPNLMRARISANEPAAAQTVRTVVTNEIVYDTSYPRKGYAPDLASLGPGRSGGECQPSAQHACLIDEVLGSPACTAGKWCQRDSYRYHLAAKCPQGKCVDFVIVATPQKPDQGLKNFCATADGVVRYQTGAPLTSPITLAQCLQWEPL